MNQSAPSSPAGGAADWFRTHQKQALMGAAAVAAVGLGLYRAKKKKSAGGTTATGTGLYDSTTGQPIATFTGTNPSTLDTTATDIAGNVDPFLQTQNSMLTQILGMLQNPTTATGANPGSTSKPPTTTPPPHSKPPTPPPHTKPPTPKQPRYYTVRKGDTLSGISQRLGVKDWHSLYNHNRAVVGSNPNAIQPGQRLVIP